LVRQAAGPEDDRSVEHLGREVVERASLVGQRRRLVRWRALAASGSVAPRLAGATVARAGMGR
jgi:hypothetical protein